MPLDARKNFAKGTVAAGYDAAAVSVVLSSGNGARFPAAPFNAVWWNATDYGDPSDDPNVEIVRVNSLSSDVMGISRGQEGTTATVKNVTGKTYRMLAGITSKTIADLLSTLSFGASFDGIGAVLVATTGRRRTMPFGGTITGWFVECDPPGSVTFDIKKGTAGGGFSMGSIVASAPPSVTSAARANSSSLTGWSPTFAAGDSIEIDIVGSPSASTFASLTIAYTQ